MIKAIYISQMMELQLVVSRLVKLQFARWAEVLQQNGCDMSDIWSNCNLLWSGWWMYVSEKQDMSSGEFVFHLCHITWWSFCLMPFWEAFTHVCPAFNECLANRSWASDSKSLDHKYESQTEPPQCVQMCLVIPDINRRDSHLDNADHLWDRRVVQPREGRWPSPMGSAQVGGGVQPVSKTQQSKWTWM